MMTTCNTEKVIAPLINEINKVWKFDLSGGQDMSEDMMISNVVTLLANNAMFHQYTW